MCSLCARTLIDCCTHQPSFSGNYDHQITNKVAGRASYVFNKDRLFPAAIAASTSTDTKFGRLQGAVAVDPQVSEPVVLYYRLLSAVRRT